MYIYHSHNLCQTLGGLSLGVEGTGLLRWLSWVSPRYSVGMCMHAASDCGSAIVMGACSMTFHAKMAC